MAHRLEMARIALAGNPSFQVSEIETARPGPHYSVDTLEEVRRQRPVDSLFFLIGGDSLIDLPQWRQPDRIAELAQIVVIDRPGFGTASEPRLDLGPAAQPLIRVRAPLIEIASHDLRRRVAGGRSIRYLVPRGVEAYIREHGLYRRTDPSSAASLTTSV